MGLRPAKIMPCLWDQRLSLGPQNLTNDMIFGELADESDKAYLFNMKRYSRVRFVDGLGWLEGGSVDED